MHTTKICKTRRWLLIYHLSEFICFDPIPNFHLLNFFLDPLQLILVSPLDFPIFFPELFSLTRINCSIALHLVQIKKVNLILSLILDIIHDVCHIISVHIASL